MMSGGNARFVLLLLMTGDTNVVHETVCMYGLSGTEYLSLVTTQKQSEKEEKDEKEERQTKHIGGVRGL